MKSLIQQIFKIEESNRDSFKLINELVELIDQYQVMDKRELIILLNEKEKVFKVGEDDEE